MLLRDQSLALSGAGREVCMAFGEFAYSIFALTKTARSSAL